ELDRAIELCTAGLERHPDYVSAHIVFGRCLIDQKNDAGAAAVFRKVLALDPENVLALKILADIAERGSRYDEAAEWLGRLLSADPMNGDAAYAVAHSAAKADGIEVQEEVELKPQDLVVEGLAHTQYEGGMFGTPSETAEDEPTIDLPLIMPDDVSEAMSIFAPPDISEEAPPAP